MATKSGFYQGPRKTKNTKYKRNSYFTLFVYLFCLPVKIMASIIGRVERAPSILNFVPSHPRAYSNSSMQILPFTFFSKSKRSFWPLNQGMASLRVKVPLESSCAREGELACMQACPARIILPTWTCQMIGWVGPVCNENSNTCCKL